MADPSPNIETELKLRFDPQHLDQLHTCSLLSGDGRATPLSKHLESVYFDTADFQLRDRRVTLRVRRVGDQYVQTIKTPGDGLRRGEWEMPVDGPAPDLAAIQDPAAWAELGSLSPDALAPIFTTRIDREVYRIEQPAVEVAVDVGEITTDTGAVEPVSEVEFELVNGSAADLFAMASGMLDGVPLIPEPRSKAERGYALAAGSGPTWTKARRFDLQPDQTVEAAMTTIFRHCLVHLGENQACALCGEDPEGVHQMRVAMRRLRSALALFRSLIPSDQLTPLVEEVRWLAGSLGHARDWDVFVAELLAPVRAAFADQPALADDLETLAHVVEGVRAQSYDAARAAILSRRYTALHLRFGQWIEGREWRRQEVSETSALLFWPITSLAVELLKRRAKKARKLGAGLADRTTEERHELRIALKKLRYTGEFFRSLFDPALAKQYLGRLSSLQDVLGHLNDVSTATRLLQSIPLEGGAARGAGLVCGWHARGAQVALADLQREWDAFRKEKPFWQRPITD